MGDIEEPEVKDLGFDPSLKKKKKSKPKITDESLESTPSGEIDDMFSGLKKKKKKATKEKDLSGAVDSVDSVDNSINDLSESLDDLKLKKKKKKILSSPTVVDDFEKQLEQAGIEETTARPESAQDSLEESQNELQQQAPGLSYKDLLSRFFKILMENNPELAGERSGPKFRIPPPIVQREGVKRTMFANIEEIAQVLQRSPKHLIEYLFAELGTSGSIDGQNRLIIKGRFQPKQIENILRRYIIDYVTCKTCKSMNTELKRESANRLHFIVCKACGSTKSVSSIKTGFQAHVGRRKKA
ncbi:hypothetical protein PACTADRAFT_69787 [Pachysolen tannophilus NRRL Y-2460]|uniref:Translation initiation factor IF2/IF5 domain-containing protein n=1 Tax=Pachysolen tannophilus NRRL Y-2460 TaxID=669874 RepID=A0A1E4TSS5_PACTA|nr:hypothetical protein PACTADRAFT_69787 [Pachysolen tannophilus NRRL Y-2460]